MRVQLLEVAWMLKLSVTNKNSFPEKWKQTWASEGLSSPDSEFILFFLSVQMDDEPFNPDYVEVDRVLDISESTDENGEVLWSLPVISHGFDSLPLSQSWSHTCVCVCLCAVGDLIFGEMVQSALRRVHVGAEGWHWPVKDRGIRTHRSPHAQH